MIKQINGWPSLFFSDRFFFLNTRATGPYRFLLVLIFVVFACSFFFPLFALSLYIEQLIRKRGKVEKKSVVTAPLEAEVVVVVVVFLFFFFLDSNAE